MGIALVKPSVAPRLPPDEVRVPLATVVWSLLTSFFPLATLIALVLG